MNSENSPTLSYEVTANQWRKEARKSSQGKRREGDTVLINNCQLLSSVEDSYYSRSRFTL
jgi:hypothetical protein